MNITEAIAQIQADVRDSLLAQRTILPHKDNWASVLPRPCLRAQVYLRLDWDKQTLCEPSLQGIFNTGKLVETLTMNTLNRIAVERCNTSGTQLWELVKQPDKINDKALAEFQIGSVTDMFLVVHDNGKPRNLGPVEVKSLNPNIYGNIKTIEDFNKYWWMRRYPGQLTTYEFGCNFEQGVFLLVNKTNWWDYKFLVHTLDMGYMQQLLDRAKEVNRCVGAKIYPDRIDDRTECEHCEFKHICLPDETSEQIELKDNPELLELLEQRDALREAAKDYEHIDEQLKEIWKRTQTGTYLVGGKFQVKLSTYERKFFNPPPDIKEKYQDSTECTKATITKLQ